MLLSQSEKAANKYYQLVRRAASGELPWPAARSSVASWLGLAKHADAFQLSRAIFTARDVRDIGKRLLVRMAATDIGSV
jgi:hypothetical protein